MIKIIFAIKQFQKIQNLHSWKINSEKIFYLLFSKRYSISIE